jgi:glycosyltransferase involved in cell wall biosynthesis
MPDRPSLLVVVQRYGDGVAGGAEAHARMLVTKLKPHLDVEVATTTARDYWTWQNEFSAGLTWVDHVPVRRFPVEKARSRMFKAYERRAFRDGRSLEDEISFVDAQGPVTPDLTEHLFRHGGEFDHVLFFTYIYWTTLFGLPVVPERSVLVPTAHDEPAIGLSLYRRVFHLPRAIAFNTAEERAMVHRRFANGRVPNEVVGVGVDVPEDLNGGAVRASAASVAARSGRFRAKHGIEGPFFLYLGRIVESKGLQDLFDLWRAWRSPAAPRATLVVAGHKEMEIPKRADIQYVGEVGDEEKWDAFAACTALVVPEKLQSLSLVTLEAWSVGRPVICPAAAPVLASMSRRASAGVPYRTPTEFAEICELLVERPELADRLGRLGREFVSRSYTWPVVVEKYLDLFAEVRARNAATESPSASSRS